MIKDLIGGNLVYLKLQKKKKNLNVNLVDSKYCFSCNKDWYVGLELIIYKPQKVGIALTKKGSAYH